ncbi:MAG: hypothetical protein V1743_06570 [Nanoarchaeota archaeon]
MSTLSESVGGLLGQFSFIFVFLLVFAIVFGVLSYINPFKDEKKGLYGIIAFIIAILVSITTPAVSVIKDLTVWFFVLGLLVFLLLFVVGIFGLKEKDYVSIIKSPQVYPWILIFAIVIALFAVSHAFGQKLLEAGSGTPGQGDVTGTVDVTTQPIGQGTSFADQLLATLFNPKVLGLILIFLIGVFTITFMTKS